MVANQIDKPTAYSIYTNGNRHASSNKSLCLFYSVGFLICTLHLAGIGPLSNRIYSQIYDHSRIRSPIGLDPLLYRTPFRIENPGRGPTHESNTIHLSEHPTKSECRSSHSSVRCP